MYTKLFRECLHLNYSITARSPLMHGEQRQQCKCLDCGLEFSKVIKEENPACKSKPA